MIVKIRVNDIHVNLMLTYCKIIAFACLPWFSHKEKIWDNLYFYPFIYSLSSEYKTRACTRTSLKETITYYIPFSDDDMVLSTTVHL